MPATSGASGPDDREVDALGARARRTRPRDVLGGDVDVAHLGLGGRAGVAGRDQHLA